MLVTVETARGLQLLIFATSASGSSFLSLKYLPLAGTFFSSSCSIYLFYNYRRPNRYYSQHLSTSTTQEVLRQPKTSMEERYTWTHIEKELLMALLSKLGDLGEDINSIAGHQRILFCFPDRTLLSLYHQWIRMRKPDGMKFWDKERRDSVCSEERSRWKMEPGKRADLLKMKANVMSWDHISGLLDVPRSRCRGYWMTYEWERPGELDLTDGKINWDKFLALEMLEKATAAQAAQTAQAAQAQENSQQVQAPMNALEEEVVPTDSQRLPDARPVPVVQEPARPTQFNPIQPPPYPILPNPIDVQSIYTHATQPYPPQLQPVQARPTSAPSLPVLPRSNIDKEMIARLDSELGFDF